MGRNGHSSACDVSLVISDPSCPCSSLNLVPLVVCLPFEKDCSITRWSWTFDLKHSESRVETRSCIYVPHIRSVKTPSTPFPLPAACPRRAVCPLLAVRGCTLCIHQTARGVLRQNGGCIKKGVNCGDRLAWVLEAKKHAANNDRFVIQSLHHEDSDLRQSEHQRRKAGH